MIEHQHMLSVCDLVVGVYVAHQIFILLRDNYVS